MAKLNVVEIPDHHKEMAKEVLSEAIAEEPDTVIVLCFWKNRGQFAIKTSGTSDRLTVLGALEEAKYKFMMDGYV